jgi:uncharacterized protein
MAGAEVVGRDEEVKKLCELAAAPPGERRLALVYGRKQVGKTTLLTRAWDEPGRVLYFGGSPISPELNRRALLGEAAAWSGEPMEEPGDSWRSVFRRLLAGRPAESAVIVLDEFQHLTSGERELREMVAELEAVWRGPLSRSGGLLLVLCSSAVELVEVLEAGGTGSRLFGRLSWGRRLWPLDYVGAGRMVSGYGPRDRILAYAAFGGTPGFLAGVDVGRPLARNIADLLLAPDGAVRVQLEAALAREDGLRDVARYRSILASVGLARREVGEIAETLGQAPDSSLKRMVKELVRMGYLEGEQNLDAPRNQPVRYRLADPAQRFYYGLVLPNASAIAMAGADAVWRDRIVAAAWPSYVDRQVFGGVVRQAYARQFVTRALPAVAKWGRWQGSSRGAPMDIDVAARLQDGRVLTGAVRFRAQPAGARLLFDHVHALEVLAADGRDWARQALRPDAPFLFVSAVGFQDSFHEVCEDQGDRRIAAWTLAELF